MFLMAFTTKSNFLKWILSVGIVLTFFSLSYFYSMMPTPDSQFFRGLAEYFIQTKNLSASQLNHSYYQWPAYFILADIVTSISGLSVASYEFLLYALIGVLLTTTLFVYASKKLHIFGLIAVAAFFISLISFIDYQAAPFSLALGLLFLLFMLETREKSSSLMVTILILYAGLLISHLFVPLFFVLYLLIRSIIEGNRQSRRVYRTFFLFTLISYFLIELTLAKFSFTQIITGLIQAPNMASYSYIVTQTVASSSVQIQINVIAQFFSRTVTIAFIGLCVLGLAVLFLQRKTGALDKAILISGVVYTALGAVLNTLGYRALAVVFIPFSLGAAFLCKGKIRLYIAGIFLILLMLFLFIPIHNSFNTEITSQTREAYVADNFFLDNYNWQNPGAVVSDFRTNTYLESKLSVYVYINPWLNLNDKANGILYTPQFVGLKLGNYSSMESLSQGDKLDLLYNDGSSYALIKSP